MARKANNPQNLIPGANKNGRPKLTEIEKAAREAERTEIAELWPTIKNLSKVELKAIKDDTSEPAIKAAMASALLKGISDGDLSEVHRFYNRLLGMPKQPIEAEVTTTDIHEKLKQIAESE